MVFGWRFCLRAPINGVFHDGTPGIRRQTIERTRLVGGAYALQQGGINNNRRKSLLGGRTGEVEGGGIGEGLESVGLFLGNQNNFGHGRNTDGVGAERSGGRRRARPRRSRSPKGLGCNRLRKFLTTPCVCGMNLPMVRTMQMRGPGAATAEAQTWRRTAETQKPGKGELESVRSSLPGSDFTVGVSIKNSAAPTKSDQRRSNQTKLNQSRPNNPRDVEWWKTGRFQISHCERFDNGLGRNSL